MPVIGSQAGTSFPASVDVLNASYDGSVGPALSQVQGTIGCFPPEAVKNVTAQSIPDIAATSSLTMTAGSVFQTPIYLRAGQTVTNLLVISAVTAVSTPTNQWFGLASPFDVLGVTDTAKVVAISADGLTAAIAADTVFTFAMTTPYVVPTSGYYIAFGCIAATTGGTFAAGVTLGAHGRGAVEGWFAGVGGTGKTTPPAVGATLDETTAASAQLLVYAN